MRNKVKQISCCSKKSGKDWLFSSALFLCLGGYIIHYLFLQQTSSSGYLSVFLKSNYELLNKMWIGLALGIFFVGTMDLIPRSVIMKILGHKKGIVGILRATLAGVLLDLCSHGILLVGMKLYERGARLSQVVAFLIASPWNSFSLTIILWALIGWKWTLLFILFSIIIAVITGLIFEKLIDKKILPDNPNRFNIEENITVKNAFRKKFENTEFNFAFFKNLLFKTILESRMILRWIFFGTILASLMKTFIATGVFATYFGPTIAGLGMTLIVATIMEICSEGSVPIAADIFTRAGAPGNSFTFLMAGIATDYTEILSIKETTKSWKCAFFLPLVTVPQVLIIGFILNFY